MDTFGHDSAHDCMLSVDRRCIRTCGHARVVHSSRGALGSRSLGAHLVLRLLVLELAQVYLEPLLALPLRLREQVPAHDIVIVARGLASAQGSRSKVNEIANTRFFVAPRSVA